MFQVSMRVNKKWQKHNKELQAPKAFAGLEERLRALRNQYVLAGYFKEQGNHSPSTDGSEIPYTTLMAIHEFGVSSHGDWPARPVMGITFNLVKMDFGNKLAPKVREYLSGAISKGQLLKEFGLEVSWKADRVFGNPSFLTVTANPTPMVLTEELANAFSWKTSVDNYLQKV
jgi:hypothetical protein